MTTSLLQDALANTTTSPNPSEGPDRLQSPRPDTPEPNSRQGRRNLNPPSVQLFDDEGGISVQLERCLKHIFAKYCVPAPSPSEHKMLLTPPENAVLTSESLDRWARDTNGTPFSEETKEELRDFLDVTDAGELTFKGFLQIYQLQTENDEEETWRDLFTHGFDRTLKLVSSRREDADEDPTPDTQ